MGGWPLVWHRSDPYAPTCRCVLVTDRPAAVPCRASQGALCQPPGWRSPGSAEDTPRGAAACARCLSQEDLQLLVELEAELARRCVCPPFTSGR